MFSNMDERNMRSTRPMNNVETVHPGQNYPYPEACILLPQSDIQTIATASQSHELQELYDNSMFYGTPRYHGAHYNDHAVILDLNVAAPSNVHLPHTGMPSFGIPVSHGSSSGSYAVTGIPADAYGRNRHLMDNVRGSYKRKNGDGVMGCYPHFSASSLSVGPSNARYPNISSYAMPQYRGNGTPLMGEVEAQGSIINNLHATSVNPLLVDNNNHRIQGRYANQLFQPAGSLWPDQRSSNISSQWSQALAVPYVHGRDGDSLMEAGVIQRYHEMPINRNSANYLHSSPVNLQPPNFYQLSLSVQGARNRNMNVYPQVAAPSYRDSANYASLGSVNPSQDGLRMGARHLGPVLPTGVSIYRPRQEGVVADATQRHYNLPHLRVLPADEVALLEIPDYYEVGSSNDHHRDMRLDIEDMAYEELLALGERIGSVNTGLSEETIASKLKTRTYFSSESSSNLDQEPGSCVICQEDYKNQEKIGILNCGHDYHTDCLKKWLLMKNVCPVCKSEALAMEGVKE